MTSARTDLPTTDLYHEVRGHGPAVLFILGATGDAGHFTRTAELLADEFTVITYDRRGNSRSRHNADDPAVASIRAQADDAAAIIQACGLAKAVVFGTSGGAIITLELLSRHADLVRGAIVHEPPLLGVLPHDNGPNPLDAIFELAQSDPPAALESFVRLNSSDTAWESIDPETRHRMLATPKPSSSTRPRSSSPTSPTRPPSRPPTCPSNCSTAPTDCRSSPA
jgi:pimeloyl-ACP methyl ester carboxylesterase